MENNIVRTAYQAMAAVLGGTQSLHTNSMDEVLALPSEKSVQIALRTQQVLAYETGVTNTIDPLAGSYFVETLTNQMEEGAEEYFRKIDELGGVLGAIRENFFQQEIADAAYRYQKEIESKDRIIVGINDFISEDKVKQELLKIDPEVERTQVRGLQAMKQSRDNLRVETTLVDLKEAAKESGNLIPKVMDAVRAYATEGEMIAVLKDVFGEYQEQAVF
jgi:methylmalonyl-CoA mutase N-terminal domain/subunit